jgi:hypothetical protein
MVPIIVYNLVQHLVAGAAAYLFGRAAGDAEATRPSEQEAALSGRPPAGASARGA